MLAVARNLVSAIRLLHLTAIFGDDPRVQIRWTIAPGSAFAAETDDYLARLGVRLTGWEQACGSAYDLIVATSGNGDLGRLRGPLMMLPHGAGYSRVVAPGQSAPAGLAASQLLRDGRVIAEVVGLEHESQQARLAAYCPQAASRGVVLGDPTRDRMAAGARLHGLYRRALGVSERQSLIVLSSTWGPHSLLEAFPELPDRLAAALPYDEYRLAAIVHPNAAASMGAWEVGRLLTRSRSAGLQLIPPDRWESSVLAADLVIGDHGSVLLYSAAVDTRVLLGTYDATQIVEGSPMADLASLIPRLQPGRELEPQIRAALNQDTRGGAYERARQAAGAAGESLERTQSVAYRLLELPLPRHKPVVRAPEPCPNGQGPRTAHLVLAERGTAPGVDLVIRRFAPGIDPDLLATYQDGEVCRHLSVYEAELDMCLRDNAEVLVLGPSEGTGGHLEQSLKSALERETSAVRVVAAVSRPTWCLLAVRDHGIVELRTDDPDVDESVLPSVLIATVSLDHGKISAAVERLRAGVRVRIGPATVTVTAS